MKAIDKRGIRLPLQPTTLVGREKALEECRALMHDPDIRLLTITGPPGVGKTRLAVELASQLAPAFEAGAAFVDLAPLQDPALALRAIAQAVGMVERAAPPLLQQLHSRLVDEHLLLLLDNFEHVLAAATDIAALLSRCPDLKILATSREALRLSWEHEYALEPLDAPDPAWLVQAEAALRYPAVALFALRARAAQPGFAVTRENGRAVAAICRRLDGLPLAIELAAARIRIFTPEALDSRLAGGLDLLTAGHRDGAERHRTLRAAIAWSHDLLSLPEQQLFRRLAVFAGGFTLHAAGEVGGVSPSEAVELVGSLMAKSLVAKAASVDEHPRCILLETVREFAHHELTAAGELDETQRRHAMLFKELAEQGGRRLGRSGGSVWRRRLEVETPNFRAAIDWTVRRDPQAALKMVAALGPFWLNGGHLAEGRGWSRAAITTCRGGADRAALADALYFDSRLARAQGDYAYARERMEECVQIRRGLGDTAGTALALASLGTIDYSRGDLIRARGLLEQALALAGECRDPEALYWTMNNLGNISQRQGAHEAAAGLYQEALTRAHDAGELTWIAGTLTNLGGLTRVLGDRAAARRHQEESVAIFREVGEQWGLALALGNLGNVLRELGEYTAAQAAYEECLSLARQMGTRRSMGFALNGLGLLALARGDVQEGSRHFAEALRIRHGLGEKLEQAITMEDTAALSAAAGDRVVTLTLSAAAAVLRESIGAQQREGDPAGRDLTSARRALGERAAAAAWEAGAAMTADQAVAYALAWLARPRGKGTRPGKLSRREAEVAALITRGLTNRQIAAELFVSERTVDTHLENILNKLGFSSRAQIAAWMAREGSNP